MKYVLAMRQFSDHNSIGEGLQANDALDRPKFIYFFVVLLPLNFRNQTFVVGNELLVCKLFVLVNIVCSGKL